MSLLALVPGIAAVVIGITAPWASWTVMQQILVSRTGDKSQSWVLTRLKDPHTYALMDFYAQLEITYSSLMLLLVQAITLFVTAPPDGIRADLIRWAAVIGGLPTFVWWLNLFMWSGTAAVRLEDYVPADPKTAGHRFPPWKSRLTKTRWVVGAMGSILIAVQLAAQLI